MGIADSAVMVAGARGEWKPMPCALSLSVNDVDATYLRAVQSGGISVMEPANQFYGDRHSGVKDPAGNYWWIATHIEDVSPQEWRSEQRPL